MKWRSGASDGESCAPHASALIQLSSLAFLSPQTDKVKNKNVLRSQTLLSYVSLLTREVEPR